jgi:hypothetical protein
MNCSRCGKNLALVGRIHNCVANTMANTITMANVVANTWDVAQPVEQRPVKSLVAGSSPAVPATYQYRDAEKRRAYMKSYMAKRRKGSQTGPMA